MVHCEKRSGFSCPVSTIVKFFANGTVSLICVGFLSFKTVRGEIMPRSTSQFCHTSGEESSTNLMLRRKSGLLFVRSIPRGGLTRRILRNIRQPVSDGVTNSTYQRINENLPCSRRLSKNMKYFYSWVNFHYFAHRTEIGEKYWYGVSYNK